MSYVLALGAGGANPLSASFWLSSLGAFGVFLVLFAETGLLIGLPGDSLLFTAGLFCTATSPVPLSLPVVLLAAAAGAVTGAQAGFVLGRRGGAALLARVRNEHLHAGLTRAEVFLTRYGHAKAIVLARFIPLVRTAINPVVGVLGVPARTFTLWQVLGGLVWSIGVTLAGYALGSSMPGIDPYLLPVIAFIAVVSVVPVVLKLVQERRSGPGQGAPDGSGDGGGRAARMYREPSR